MKLGKVRGGYYGNHEVNLSLGRKKKMYGKQIIIYFINPCVKIRDMFYCCPSVTNLTFPCYFLTI